MLICAFFKEELWPLTCVRISYRLNILRLNEKNVIQIYILINIDKLMVGIGMH